ncbi:DUF4974 domain-containing protein [Mucilaginibacter pallidiroseus]|uniref:DUF4974 domain-containing protein n=1 Tax=Mucilaginibacter pallidiroseus TaxID=2599295 RepID=A0A563UE99_9SPHI|nr:FecR family protein [Mucilaginibacter pallidiroseus]TWR29626.1 DUF4974 domain-containing protein [Mucilaginibacter pallidiroseus]
MQPTAQLIAKFFNRQCTSEEAEQVYQFFKENPDELERYLADDDWKNFAKYSQPLEERTDRMLGNILKQVDDTPLVRVIKLRNRVLMGAAAIFCLAVGFLLLFDAKTPVGNVHQQVAINKTVDSADWKTITNTSSAQKNIKLDDGSTVVLSAKASIKYQLPFKRPLRNMYLKGKAKFFVAKDKARPFTVYGGPLATTALGTVFTVTAWPGTKVFKVRLLSGKVKVWQHASSHPTNILLLPGKELVFDEEKLMARVSNFAVSTLAMVKGTTTVNGDDVKFSNQQLPAVMQKLQEVYGVHIQAKANLKKYYFTGEFNTRHDSIGNVLGTIMSLNNLKYTLTDSTYTITKP